MRNREGLKQENGAGRAAEGTNALEGFRRKSFQDLLFGDGAGAETRVKGEDECSGSNAR